MFAGWRRRVGALGSLSTRPSLTMGVRRRRRRILPGSGVWRTVGGGGAGRRRTIGGRGPGSTVALITNNKQNISQK